MQPISKIVLTIQKVCVAVANCERTLKRPFSFSWNRKWISRDPRDRNSPAHHVDQRDQPRRINEINVKCQRKTIVFFITTKG